MGFIIKEDSEITYVHCKLTEEGRRKIAEGSFNPIYFSVGDSEIDYSYYDNEENPLFTDSLVLKPRDRQLKIKYPILNLSGATTNKYSYELLDSEIITYEKEIPDTGFFSGSTYSYSAFTTSEYTVQSQIRINISQLNSENNKTLDVVKSTTYGSNTNEPNIGDYLLVNWRNPYIDSNNFENGIIDSSSLTPFLWYKIMNKSGLLSNNTLELTLDRDLPNFGTGLTTTYSYGIIYPSFNSMEGFYNSVSPSDYWEDDVLNFNKTCNTPPISSNIWNLNILFTEDIAGILSSYKQLKDQNSAKYAGFLTFISSSNFNYKNIGLIHYSNNNPSNKYGENFVEDVFINLPTILWHKNEDNKLGAEFKSDTELKTFKEGIFELNYFDLIDDWDNVVGVVFPDIKLITITDQELLYAMSYKSNRNWTLVEPDVNFVDSGCPIEPGNIGTYYYGRYEVTGGIVAIPTENDINFATGVAVNNVNLNDFAITIPFNSGVNDFIWFAIPSIFPLRTEWFVNVINKGSIGGAKIISGNLFPDPVLVTYNTIEYRLYISNYRTNAEFIDVIK
jgi:hypothetical protein